MRAEKRCIFVVVKQKVAHKNRIHAANFSPFLTTATSSRAKSQTRHSPHFCVAASLCQRQPIPVSIHPSLLATKILAATSQAIASLHSDLLLVPFQSAHSLRKYHSGFDKTTSKSLPLRFLCVKERLIRYSIFNKVRTKREAFGRRFLFS